MYLVLKRFFCALLANIQQALQLGIVTLQKIVLYRFARKSSFIGQGKKHPVDYNSHWKPFPLFVIWKSTTLARNSWRNERSKKTYKKFSHRQPSLSTLLRAVRRLNTKDSNSQSDKSLLCWLSELSQKIPTSSFGNLRIGRIRTVLRHQISIINYQISI